MKNTCQMVPIVGRKKEKALKIRFPPTPIIHLKVVGHVPILLIFQLLVKFQHKRNTLLR